MQLERELVHPLQPAQVLVIGEDSEFPALDIHFQQRDPGDPVLRISSGMEISSGRPPTACDDVPHR